MLICDWTFQATRARVDSRRRTCGAGKYARVATEWIRSRAGRGTASGAPIEAVSATSQ